MALNSRPCHKAQLAAWDRFIPVILAVLYLLYTIGSVWTRGLFDFVGTDYGAFRCSGQIALTSGFAQVYDLALQEQCQAPLYKAYAREAAESAFAPVPTPYPPLFLFLFLPLPLFSPVAGLIFWILLNALLLTVYLVRFARAIGQVDPVLLSLILLSFATFQTLFFGQVDVFLLIFVGEFYLAVRRNHDFMAGLWLAGLLMKPQVLLLLLPGLLLARRFKALAGFTLAGVAVLLFSLPLAGIKGLVDLVNLILRYPGNLATTSPQLMMNWRALAVNLETLRPGPLAWGLAIVGIVVTAAAALSLWLRPSRVQAHFSLILLGTYAATCAISWHSHVHMALPSAVPLFALAAAGQPARRLLTSWAALPALVFFVIVPMVGRLAMNVVGISMLAVNVAVVAWAAYTFWRPPIAREVSQTGPAKVE